MVYEVVKVKWLKSSYKNNSKQHLISVILRHIQYIQCGDCLNFTITDRRKNTFQEWYIKDPPSRLTISRILNGPKTLTRRLSLGTRVSESSFWSKLHVDINVNIFLTDPVLHYEQTLGNPHIKTTKITENRTWLIFSKEIKNSLNYFCTTTRKKIRVFRGHTSYTEWDFLIWCG